MKCLFGRGGISSDPEMILKSRVLEWAAMDVGDISEERGCRREKRRRGSGGRCRWRRWRRRRMTGLRLCIIWRAISVYAAVMQADAAYQKILLDSGLMAQLL